MRDQPDQRCAGAMPAAQCGDENRSIKDNSPHRLRWKTSYGMSTSIALPDTNGLAHRPRMTMRAVTMAVAHPRKRYPGSFVAERPIRAILVALSLEKTRSMSRVSIRRQGSATIMTIPPEVLKALHLDVGAQMEVAVTAGRFTAEKPKRRRYSLRELLRGVTPGTMRLLQEETAWAHEGSSVGRELDPRDQPTHGRSWRTETL
jgi:antitoxin ChpS